MFILRISFCFQRIFHAILRLYLENDSNWRGLFVEAFPGNNFFVATHFKGICWLSEGFRNGRHHSAFFMLSFFCVYILNHFNQEESFFFLCLEASELRRKRRRKLSNSKRRWGWGGKYKFLCPKLLVTSKMLL